MHAILRLEGDGGGGAGFVVVVHSGGDFEITSSKNFTSGAQGLADQELKSAFGGFKLIAQKFEVLDTFEQLAAGVLGQEVCDSMLLEFIEDVAASGKIAEQDALAIADDGGRDVLVGGRIAEDGGDVNSTLMGERAVADVGLVVAERQVG